MVEQSGDGSHFHGCGEFTHLHRDVEGRLLLDRERDVGLVVPFETLRFHAEGIIPGRQRRQRIASSIVRYHHVRDVAIGLGNSDFCARHRSSAGVTDYAANSGRI